MKKIIFVTILLLMFGSLEDVLGQVYVRVILMDEQGNSITNARMLMQMDKGVLMMGLSGDEKTFTFRHLGNGVYQSQHRAPTEGQYHIQLTVNVPGHDAHKVTLTHFGSIREGYQVNLPLQSPQQRISEMISPQQIMSERQSPDPERYLGTGTTDVTLDVDKLIQDLMGISPRATVREEQPAVQLSRQTDQGTTVDDGVLIAIPVSGTDQQYSTIRLTSSAGVPLENARVRMRFENPASSRGPSVTIDLDHVGSGLYRTKEPFVEEGFYRVTAEVRADDHADVKNLIISPYAEPPVRESLTVFHNNYYDRCRGRLGGRRHNYPDSPWNDCTVNAIRLIESFGVEERLINFGRVSPITGSAPFDGPPGTMGQSVYKFAPDINYAFNNIESYNMRRNAYKTILEELFKGTARIMATAQSQEISKWLEEHMRTNNDLAIGTLAAQGGQLITGFSETLKDFGEAFEIIGATLDLEDAFRRGTMDGVLMYLAYQSTAGDILDYMEMMIRQSDSWLANDNALKSALSEVRNDFEKRRDMNMRQMAQAVRSATVNETVGEIILGGALKTALSQAGISVTSLVTGKAATAVVVGSVKVAVAVAVYATIRSIHRTNVERALLAAALQMDRYLLDGGVPDRFEASLVPRLRDEELTGMLIRLQLGVLYNEARAALFAGNHRTWIGYQFRYSDTGPKDQNQAYELRMVEVSQQKSARAEADLERLAQEIFRRQRIQAPVTERREVIPPTVGDWPRDTRTAVVDVRNPRTGRVWMDRNLGASRAARSSTDSQAYGDLYQWGRAADGHQRRNSPTTSTLSRSDQPGHSSFTLVPNRPWDWRSPQNDNLWYGVNGGNNPCPPGYRLPSYAEWDAEIDSWRSNSSSGAFGSPLKLPVAGGRSGSSGSLYVVGSLGGYWSSTVSGSGARVLVFDSSYASMGSSRRAFGRSVRCLKD